MNTSPLGMSMKTFFCFIGFFVCLFAYFFQRDFTENWRFTWYVGSPIPWLKSGLTKNKGGRLGFKAVGELICHFPLLILLLSPPDGSHLPMVGKGILLSLNCGCQDLSQPWDCKSCSHPIRNVLPLFCLTFTLWFPCHLHSFKQLISFLNRVLMFIQVSSLPYILLCLRKFIYWLCTVNPLRSIQSYRSLLKRNYVQMFFQVLSPLVCFCVLPASSLGGTTNAKYSEPNSILSTVLSSNNPWMIILLYNNTYIKHLEPDFFLQV